MSATDERLVQPIPRQSRPHASLESEAEELTQKLSMLSCDSTGPTHHIKSPTPCRDDKGTTPFHVRDSRPVDSGYASLVSTPDTNKGHPGGAGLPIRHPSSRDIIDKPIPEDLNNRFLDFKILYTEALWKAVSGKRNKNIGDISMKLRYKGETEADAQLFIVVQCEKRILKRIKKFFELPDVKESLGSDLRPHFIDSALIRLFSSETATVSASPGSIQGTTCGTAIEINLNGLYRRATIGGMIEVISKGKSELYALTAGHPLASLGIDSSESFSEYSSNSSDESSSEAGDDIHYDGNYELFPLSKSHSGPIYNAGGLKKQIGTISISSFHSSTLMGNHDWALIHIEPYCWKPNIIRSLSRGSGKERESRGSGDEREKLSPISIGNVKSEHENIDYMTELVITIDTNPSKQPAAVITCRGIQRGTLSSSHTALFMSPSNGFIETLDFLPTPNSSLIMGDSGAWVINEASGEVYGHIVAVDGLGEAHVMPIGPTLRNIASQLEAENVELASRHAVDLQYLVHKSLIEDPKQESGDFDAEPVSRLIHDNQKTSNDPSKSDHIRAESSLSPDAQIFTPRCREQPEVRPLSPPSTPPLAPLHNDPTSVSALGNLSPILSPRTILSIVQPLGSVISLCSKIAKEFSDNDTMQGELLFLNSHLKKLHRLLDFVQTIPGELSQLEYPMAGPTIKTLNECKGPFEQYDHILSTNRISGGSTQRAWLIDWPDGSKVEDFSSRIDEHINELEFWSSEVVQQGFNTLQRSSRRSHDIVSSSSFIDIGPTLPIYQNPVIPASFELFRSRKYQIPDSGYASMANSPDPLTLPVDPQDDFSSQGRDET